jgi:hypothetical protein
MKIPTEILSEVFLVFYEDSVAVGRSPAEVKSAVDEMRASLVRLRSRSGLIQGINDELTGRWIMWPPSYRLKIDRARKAAGAPSQDQERENIDRILKAKGLPSLLELELVLKNKYRRIVERKSIKSDEEFYIVKEILDGPVADKLDPKVRKLLDSLMSTYKAKPPKA